MTPTNDVSLNTLIITAAIAGGSWLLKNGIKALVEQLVRNYVKMVSLELKMEKFDSVIEAVPKLKKDVDASFERIRKVEEKFQLPDKTF